MLVLWLNVGLDHKSLQIGRLLSMGITAVVCLLWYVIMLLSFLLFSSLIVLNHFSRTIPMSFFASLSSVEALKAEFDWIADAIDAFPFLEPLLQQTAPLLVVLVNSLLPIILSLLSKMEGPISGAVVEAILFSKLAAFAIIQTFFVSAISGGLLEALSDLVEDPTSIVDLLATSLPSQSTYFVQIVFVQTSIISTLELLRVVPLVMAFIRKFVGPKLTEKEQRTPFFGFRPLAAPAEFAHADNLSKFSCVKFITIFTDA
jgi:hypothetical protein